VSLDDLDVRYGRRTPHDPRRLLTVALAAFGVLALAWAVWAGVTISRSTIDWRTTSVDTSDPALVRLSLAVTQAAGRTAICSVRATDAGGRPVGWTDVRVPASPTGTATVTTTLRTTRAATDGTVVTCVRG
jgi:hypothetical protein